MLDIYEDRIRNVSNRQLTEFISPYQDFRTYPSSVTPGIRLAMNVIKPVRPEYILCQLHGWHMSMPKPEKRQEPLEGNDYLLVQVDMRGRAFSEGNPDCNGLELIDIYDAVQFVRQEYKDWIKDEAVVYLEGGSGGGGNVLATVNKFPDLFAAATGLYGISDYAMWYEMDEVGEFRDEMDVWIGCDPMSDPERYRARSGLFLAENQLTPLYIAHGNRDARVQVMQSRVYVQRAVGLGKGPILQYDELDPVGGFGHEENISETQKHRLESRKRDNKLFHQAPVTIPGQGQFAVGGYLYTKPFTIWLDSIDHLATLTYDLTENWFIVEAERPYGYEITLRDGTVIRGKAAIKP